MGIAGISVTAAYTHVNGTLQSEQLTNYDKMEIEKKQASVLPNKIL